MWKMESLPPSEEAKEDRSIQSDAAELIDFQESDKTTIEAKQDGKTELSMIIAKQQKENEEQHSLYSKTTGAMSVTGQLYETKLLTLMLLRLVERAVNFLLGANNSCAGVLDDLCFKYKPANSDKHIIVFLQAKHKVNPDKGKITMTDVQSYGGDFSVAKHFESYLIIRQRFTPKSSDIIFKGAYHDSRCYFVVYTPLKHDIQCRRPLELNDTNSHVKDLIETNHAGDMFQLEYKQAEFLTKQLVTRNVKHLGKVFFELITKGNVNNMMDDKLIKMYHVVLVQNVVESIEGGAADDVRYKFRSEFFENNEEFTSIFREKLYDEAMNNRAYKPLDNIDFQSQISNFLNDNMATGSNNIVYQKNDFFTNQFFLIEDKYNVDRKFQVSNIIGVEPSKMRNNVSVKGKKLLESLEFTLPVGLANRDLTLKGDIIKIEKRLDFIATNLLMLLEKAKNVDGVHVVEVDERMVGPGKLVARGVVEHDGGLGSALGNLLVLDTVTGALKFNASATLPEYANRLWNKLRDKHDEQLLTTYQFKFRVDCFPKTSFQDDLYEEYLVKDFIDQYWLCTGQAKEDAVEFIVKENIIKLLENKKRNDLWLHAKSDAVFLMLHDKVQKWWLMPGQAEYLTEDITFIQHAIADVGNDCLLSVLSYICVSNLKRNEIQFEETALDALDIDKVHSHRLVLIFSDSVKHTALKLLQHDKYTENCMFIDLDYVARTLNSHLAQEITNSHVESFAITWNVTQHSVTSKSLARLIQEVLNKNITVITYGHVAMELKSELTCPYHEVRDDKNGLIDLCAHSKMKILNEAKFVYQGEDVLLKSIIGAGSQYLITPHILEKLVNKEVIKVGKPIATSRYNNMKQFYIKRYMARREMRSNVQNVDYISLSGSKKDSANLEFVFKKYQVKTLVDFAQNIVVVTGAPGMGKSTLMTHLSLETKKKYPNLWIARINLLDHTQQLHKWKQHKKKVIDKRATMSFMLEAEMNGRIDDVLQVELFINKCYNAEVIFIFDGFDEICPLYEKEVIQLMKATTAIAHPLADTMKKPKLWIASRSYNNVKHVIEREFGLSYTLEPLSTSDQRLYFEKYWKQHMKLDEFTYEQFVNVTSFMKYMRKIGNTNRTIGMKIDENGSSFCQNMYFENFKPIHVALYGVYVAAAEYFRHEINNVTVSADTAKLTAGWHQGDNFIPFYQLLLDKLKHSSDFEQITGCPLYMQIAAEFLQTEIQHNLQNGDMKWDVDKNTFSLYIRLLETKLTKIRFEEKNRIDVSNPDSKLIHDNEQAAFIETHQLLACYALFRDHAHEIMTPNEKISIKSMIKKIKYSTEKTGVIDCIVDDVPRFVHLTFAEYFAANHICEALKTAYASQQVHVQENIWDFILKKVIMFTNLGVSGLVDYVLFNEEILKEIAEEEQTERIVYQCLMKQAGDVVLEGRTAIDCAVSSRLKSTAIYLINCIGKHLTSNELKVFINLVRNNDLLWIALKNGYEDIVELITNIVGQFDKSASRDLLKRSRIIFGLIKPTPATTASEDCDKKLMQWDTYKTWGFF